MRISDWSSDVCSSDLAGAPATAPMLALANEILLYLLFACAFLLGGSSGEASLRIFLICLAASASLAVALASGAWGAVWKWPVLLRVALLLIPLVPLVQLVPLPPGLWDALPGRDVPKAVFALIGRSEEHTSELQSLMRISYAVFCLKKKKHHNIKKT